MNYIENNMNYIKYIYYELYLRYYVSYYIIWIFTLIVVTLVMRWRNSIHCLDIQKWLKFSRSLQLIVMHK